MLTALLASLHLAVPTMHEEVGAPAIAPVQQQVYLRLSKHSNLRTGDRVRAYVRASADGYLTVFRTEPDGRVRVLFPLDPFDDNFVRGGQEYELKGRGDRDSFTVYSSTGVGTVYAAFSRDPFRYDEYVRGYHWDYAQTDVWQIGSDPETDLTYLAETMAGALMFDYDVVRYSVGRPRPYSPSQWHHTFSGLRYYDHHHHYYDSYWHEYGYSHRPRFSVRVHFGSRYYPSYHYRVGHVGWAPYYWDPIYYGGYDYYGYRYDWYPRHVVYGVPAYRHYGFHRAPRVIYVESARSVNRAYTFKSAGGGAHRVADLRTRTPSNPVSRRAVGSTRSSSAGESRVTTGRRVAPSGSDGRRLSSRGGVVRSVRSVPQGRERAAAETRRTYPAREVGPSARTATPRARGGQARAAPERTATPSRRAAPAPRTRGSARPSTRVAPRNRSARPRTSAAPGRRPAAAERSTRPSRGRAAVRGSSNRARVSRPSAPAARGRASGGRSARPARPSSARGRAGSGRSARPATRPSGGRGTPRGRSGGGRRGR